MKYPRPNKYPRGRGCIKKLVQKANFLKESHTAENEPTPQLSTLPNTLGSYPKPNNCRQLIRIVHKNSQILSANQKRARKNS